MVRIAISVEANARLVPADGLELSALADVAPGKGILGKGRHAVAVSVAQADRACGG